MIDPITAPATDPVIGPASRPMAGRRIGNYRVMRLIGRGGMGAVYEVIHEEIGQRAAIKVLDPSMARKRKQVERFFDEARAISMVAHPGLVKIFDFDSLPDGTVYILMELLEGEGLWTRFLRLKKQAAWLSLGEALRITRQIACALSAVHAKGIIHRDLKPENIILVKDPEAISGERTKLLDFGIAKISEPGKARRTTVGAALGTPHYMSPEQCSGEPHLTDRSDVYSLGVLCYEMIAGALPFDSAEKSLVMASHIFREPRLLSALPAPPPESVSTLVHQMLAKEPTQRPSMIEISDRLKALALTGQIADFVAVDPSHVLPASKFDPAATVLSGGANRATLRSRVQRTAAMRLQFKQPRRLRNLLVPLLASLAGCLLMVGLMALAGMLPARPSTGVGEIVTNKPQTSPPPAPLTAPAAPIVAPTQLPAPAAQEVVPVRRPPAEHGKSRRHRPVPRDTGECATSPDNKADSADSSVVPPPSGPAP